jgi:formate hydrogenlyase subunit 6/NADH:ubiquinone oxidoreductase subunit I
MKKPGVMIPTLLGRMKKKPVTVLYPYEKLDPAPGLRGKIKFHLDKCISCGMCARDCPSAACVMKEIDGKKRPVFDMDRCTFCAQCEESCPKDAIEMTQEYELAHFKRGEAMVV